MRTSFRSGAIALLAAFALLTLVATPLTVHAQTAAPGTGTSPEHSPDMDPDGVTVQHSPDMDPNGAPTAVFDAHSPDMDPNGLQADPIDPLFGPGSWIRALISRVFMG